MTIPATSPQPASPAPAPVSHDPRPVIPEGDYPTSGIYAVDTISDPAALRAALLADAGSNGQPQYEADQVLMPTESGMYRVPTEPARATLSEQPVPSPEPTPEPAPAPKAPEPPVVDDEVAMPDIREAAKQLVVEGKRVRLTGLPAELAEEILRAKSDPAAAASMLSRLKGQAQESPAPAAEPDPVATAPASPTPDDILAQMDEITSKIAEADPYDAEAIRDLQAEMAKAQVQYAKAMSAPAPAKPVPAPEAEEAPATPEQMAYTAAFDADEASVRRFVPEAFDESSPVRQTMNAIHREMTASANPADKAALESPQITSLLAEKALARLAELQQTPGQVPGLRVAPGPSGTQATSAQPRVEARTPATVFELNEQLIQEGLSPAEIRAAILRG